MNNFAFGTFVEYLLHIMHENIQVSKICIEKGYRPS